MMRTIVITLLLAQCCQFAAADEPKSANEDSLKSLDLACAETPLAIQIAAAADAPTVQ